MLTALPLEVSCSIVRYLETTELLVCLQTCRDWRAFIRAHKLIRELEPETSAQYFSIITAVQNEYINGDQITILRLTNPPPPNSAHSLLQIPDLFPALKTFEMEGSSCLTNELAHADLDHDTITFGRWRGSLEKLCLAGEASVMSFVIKTGHFEQLTKLDLGYEHDSNWDVSTDEDFVISSIKYLTQLKSLALHGSEITFQTIEEIHKSLTLLEKLELDYALILFPATISMDVVPAVKIKELKIRVMQFHENEPSLLKYIIAKYPSLTCLDVLREFPMDTLLMKVAFEAISKTMDPAMLSFVTKLPPTITTFFNMLTCTTKTFIDTLDHFYASSLSNLTEFCLWSNDVLNFESASLSYCYSKTMFKNLTSLLMGSYRLDAVYPDLGFTTHLKKLEFMCDLAYDERVDQSRKVFYLDRVFKLHPLLEELYVYANGCQVEIYDDTYDDLDKLRIKELCLSVGTFSDDVIPFIQATMPRLRRLQTLIDVKPTKKKEEQLEHFLFDNDNEDEDEDDEIDIHGYEFGGVQDDDNIAYFDDDGSNENDDESDGNHDNHDNNEDEEFAMKKNNKDLIGVSEYNHDDEHTDENKTRFKQTISLPTHELEQIDMNIDAKPDNIVCVVNSIFDNKQKYYRYSKREGKCIFYGTDPTGIEEREEESYYYVVIECKSLFHLIINEIRIF